MASQGEKGPTDVETGAQITDDQQQVMESRLPDQEVG